jgi:hypothetical protein
VDGSPEFDYFDGLHLSSSAVMEAAVETRVAKAVTSRQAQIIQIKPEGEKTACTRAGGGRVLVSNTLAAHICPGDEIDFPLALDSAATGTEIYIRTTSPSARSRDLYDAPIGYAGQPKSDRRDQPNVHAEVHGGRLGISALHFPCGILRDYFYVVDRRLPWEKQKTLYDILRSVSNAAPAELRLAFRLRELELRAEDASRAVLSAAERAFNILANPELRACYESLLSNSAAPALFPYGGFGQIIVLGDRARDGQTFFVRRIVSFLPESRNAASGHPCASLSSTATRHCTATHDESSKSWWTNRQCPSSGTRLGTSGSISSEPK